MQRLAKALDRRIEGAEDADRPHHLRRTDVRFARWILTTLERATHEQCGGRPLPGAFSTRIRLLIIGEALGMAPDDDRPRLKDKPEFNMVGGSRMGRRTKRPNR
jgi:hypothetical protein